MFDWLRCHDASNGGVVHWLKGLLVLFLLLAEGVAVVIAIARPSNGGVFHWLSEDFPTWGGDVPSKCS